jgi:serine protein kinase
VQAQPAGLRHRRRAHAQAIGEPTNGRHPQRPAPVALFANKVIKIYPAFAEFYGMEDAIEQVVSYFRHAAQGLEEKKQILYLLGPVGGGKSSIAERLKQLMQQVPFYAIKGSPVNESPLGLFDPPRTAPSWSRNTASRAATSTAS